MMLDAATALEVLRDGEIELVGRLIGSTNHAMLARVTRVCPPPEPPQTIEAVYKPTAGERPLDDFPDGTLSRREVAAFLVSEATGWGIVPPTVLRDGPFGEGALQAWIDVDESVDVVAMVVEDDPRLRRIAVFDAAVNNTDRKGGHLLPVAGGATSTASTTACCFSTLPEAADRAVGLARPAVRGRRASAGLRRDRRRACAATSRGSSASLLSRAEIAATRRRVDELLDRGRFPYPRGDWPAIPWPPF